MVISRRLSTGAVVITGASSGIGQACALHLDKLGFRVFAGIRSERDGIALRSKASERLTPIFLDVAEAFSIESAANTVSSAVGDAGLVGLINNAGIAIAGPLEFLPISELRKQLEVNVIGQIAVTQAFLPLLRRGHGRVINVGSLGGRVALPFLGPYHASKFAMEALTDSLRIELRPWHIHVSLVEPGITVTPLWEKSIGAADNALKGLPQQAYHSYSAALNSAYTLAANVSRRGTQTNVIVRAITHALTAKSPKTRYLVGRGAKVGALVFGHLPDRLRDYLITHLLPKEFWR